MTVLFFRQDVLEDEFRKISPSLLEVYSLSCILGNWSVLLSILHVHHHKYCDCCCFGEKPSAAQSSAGLLLCLSGLQCSAAMVEELAHSS